MDQNSPSFPTPNPLPQQADRISLFRQIRQLREKSSKLTKIIILLVLIMLVTVTGFFGYFVYQKFFNNSFKKLPFDITKDIINKPQATSNKVEAVSGEKKLLDDKLISTYSIAQIDRISSTLYPSYSTQTAKYPADEYVIHFLSTDQNGQPLTIKAALFVPKGAEGQKFPLFVFGQGTTGIGDQCAPSMERPEVSNWGNYYNHLRTYAGQGFITVFPDYEGFNDDKRIHHYFNSLLEAHVLLDATRATFEFLPDKSEQAAFYAGYSQGGHAAFAVKDYQPTYAPEVPIKGVIGFGATTNIVNLLKENADLAPYLFYSYADFYGKDKVDVSALMQPNWLPTFEKDVLGKCISTVPSYYGTNASRVYSSKFYDSLFNGKLDQDFPELNKLFTENSSGLKSSSTPGLLIQGDPDPIVTVKSQEEFIKQACSTGNVITYNKYNGVHHFQTRHVSFKDVTSWMRSILAGNKPKSVCENLGDLNTSNIKVAPLDNSQNDGEVVAPPGGGGGG